MQNTEEKCLVCGNPIADPHHYKTRGAGGERTIHLCRVHHEEWHLKGREAFCVKYFGKPYDEMKNIWDKSLPLPDGPLFDIQTVDVAQIKAEGDTLLLESQKQLEEIVRVYGESEDSYADAIIAYENGRSDGYKRLMEKDPKLKVTTAKTIARESCNDHYKEMIKLEHSIKKLAAYREGVSERIKTLKAILKIPFNELGG